MAETIQEVLDLYVQTVREKDKQLLLSLYCDDVLIYDVAGQWALRGKQELSAMVEGWFHEIATDKVEVSFSNLEIYAAQACAFAYFDARFAKVGFEQSVTDRFTLGFIYDKGWKIKHQHASHPLGSSH